MLTYSKYVKKSRFHFDIQWENKSMLSKELYFNAKWVKVKELRLLFLNKYHLPFPVNSNLRIHSFSLGVVFSLPLTHSHTLFWCVTYSSRVLFLFQVLFTKSWSSYTYMHKSTRYKENNTKNRNFKMIFPKKSDWKN